MRARMSPGVAMPWPAAPPMPIANCMPMLYFHNGYLWPLSIAVIRYLPVRRLTTILRATPDGPAVRPQLGLRGAARGAAADPPRAGRLGRPRAGRAAGPGRARARRGGGGRPPPARPAVGGAPPR